MKTEWISVKTELPKEQGRFNIKTKSGVGNSLYHPKYGFDYNNKCDEYAVIVGMGTPDEVTHWKPILPEPPKHK